VLVTLSLGFLGRADRPKRALGAGAGHPAPFQGWGFRLARSLRTRTGPLPQHRRNRWRSSPV